MLRPLALALTLLLLLASDVASRTAPEATPAVALPEAPAPGGLGRVQLPADRADITALFGRLPETIAGEPRAETDRRGPTDRLVVAYGADDPVLGPQLTLQALDLSSGAFFPADFTAGIFVASVASVPDYRIDAFGRDGDLVWVRASTTVSGEGDRPGTPISSRPLLTLSWGNTTSPWLFSATAPTPDDLDALVDAFVATAKSDPGTAVPDATPAAGTHSASAPDPTVVTSTGSIVDRASFITALRAEGITVATGEEIEQPFFRPESGRLLLLSGNDLAGETEVQVYEYADPAAARADAEQIDPDGHPRTVMVSWMAPPHFFRQGNLIVLYVGDDPAVVALLTKLLGPQFAGQ